MICVVYAVGTVLKIYLKFKYSNTLTSTLFVDNVLIAQSFDFGGVLWYSGLVLKQIHRS